MADETIIVPIDDIDLMTLLPLWFQEILDFREIMSTEEIELSLFWATMTIVWLNQYIQTADADTLKYHEDLLELIAEPDDTIELRRWRIINRYKRRPPFTLPYLYQELNSILGVGTYTVDIDYPGYHMTVNFINQTDERTLREAYKILIFLPPAHLGQTYTYTHLPETMATYYYGGIMKEYIDIRMPVTEFPVAGVRLNQSSITVDAGGDPFTLTASIIPSLAENHNVIWSSSNTNIVQIVDNGLEAICTQVGIGSANITVTTEDGGYTASCAVTVTGIPVTAINLTRVGGQTSSSYIYINADQMADQTQYSYIDFHAEIEPTNASFKDISWAIESGGIGSTANTYLDFSLEVIDSNTVRLYCHELTYTDPFYGTYSDCIVKVYDKTHTVNAASIRIIGAVGLEDFEISATSISGQVGDVIPIQFVSYSPADFYSTSKYCRFISPNRNIFTVGNESGTVTSNNYDATLNNFVYYRLLRATTTTLISTASIGGASKNITVDIEE